MLGAADGGEEGMPTAYLIRLPHPPTGTAYHLSLPESTRLSSRYLLDTM
jgi:hypothetical protein